MQQNAEGYRRQRGKVGRDRERREIGSKERRRGEIESEERHRGKTENDNMMHSCMGLYV